MSGHSRWAGIKHKKAAQDAKKGKIFSKLVKEITVATKEGGPDPEKNPKLRLVIQKAKQYNMPQDNIKKAIERSVKNQSSYETVHYEGYGPGGVAVIVEAQTDNRNRTTQEIRRIFSKHGGNLGEVGCVGWMFNKKGFILVDKSFGEEKLMELLFETTVEDMKESEEGFEITTDAENFEEVHQFLKSKNVPVKTAEITNIPQTYIKLEGDEARKMLALMDALENHDDVTETAANFDIPQEIMEEFANG